MSEDPPDLLQIEEASTRIAPYVHRTPILTSRTLNELAGATLVFKCENLQRIGAFKARGAHNAVLTLSAEQLGRGVVTHSSGNHAAALALAARNSDTFAYIVMPTNAPKSKVASVQRLGGQITFCEPTLAARESTAHRVEQETGATLVHPYDNWRVITGQATAAWELLQDSPDLEALTTPVGGGGLLSGTALVGSRRGIPVFGCEPSGADDAHRSFRSGQLIPLDQANTVADGLRTSLGERPFSVIQKHVTDIVTVSDEAILQAMKLVWQVLKIIIEPSSAVPVAALLERRLPVLGKRVGVILSGGNVDFESIPWLSRPDGTRS